MTLNLIAIAERRGHAWNAMTELSQQNLPAAVLEPLTVSLMDSAALADEVTHVAALLGDNAVLLNALRQLADAATEDDYFLAHAAAKALLARPHPGQALLEEREALCGLVNRAQESAEVALAQVDRSLAMAAQSKQVATNALTQAELWRQAHADLQQAVERQRRKLEIELAHWDTKFQECDQINARLVEERNNVERERDEAVAQARRLEAELDAVRREVAGLPRPGVQVRIWDAVVARGYAAGYTKKQLVARQLTKLVEEVGEAVGYMALSTEGLFDEELDLMRARARRRFDERDWTHCGPDPDVYDLVTEELYDCQVVLCCLASVLGELRGQSIDLMGGALRKAEKDISRGVR